MLRLLKTHYPKYVALYESFEENIYKANFMRFFIMHRYGGVYADLDFECLRPLDNWTVNNECIMSENHHVHSYFVARRETAEVMITFLAAQPNHFYFRLAIEMLSLYKNMDYGEKLLYADMVYRIYLAGKLNDMPGYGVTVTHPDYFLPAYDKEVSRSIHGSCEFEIPVISDRKKIEETCNGLKDGTEGQKPKAFSYGNHHWAHTILWKKRKLIPSKIPIVEVVPTYQVPRI